MRVPYIYHHLLLCCIGVLAGTYTKTHPTHDPPAKKSNLEQPNLSFDLAYHPNLKANSAGMALNKR